MTHENYHIMRKNKTEWQRILLLLIAYNLSLIVSPAFNVKDFGAVGDGRHIDSPAINAAIERAASQGGGTVVLPQGTYLCYSVHLQSNITLRFEREL